MLRNTVGLEWRGGGATKHRAGARSAEAVCDEIPETPTNPGLSGGNGATPRYPEPDHPECRMRPTASARLALAACVFALCVAAGAPAAMAASSQDPAAAASPAVARLQALYTDEWAWRQREFGYERVDGEGQPSNHFPSV